MQVPHWLSLVHESVLSLHWPLTHTCVPAHGGWQLSGLVGLVGGGRVRKTNHHTAKATRASTTATASTTGQRRGCGSATANCRCTSASMAVGCAPAGVAIPVFFALLSLGGRRFLFLF
ncbi:hypothetical protein TW95_gp1033 [Pandoravirus inopinatum]|uniref:Uncharacterized protein n=1 Tax=Pandoravirus inopinatum TaxID=1605721 RepID=A0A0B5JDI1_9VIRU|nr:hypothetical protein TW95_gp1033 [Pandoravirus inopinatum]AJF97767.1 hypothetical protein [Pandoravirus inopinatum]